VVSDSFIRGAPKAALAVFTFAATLAAASCTVPLGPGFTIERQRIAVAFEPSPQPHVRVRATWRVKNTGNQPLSAVEVNLPTPASHVASELKGGSRDLTPSHTDAGDTASIAFASPLAVKAKEEVGVSYELSGAPTAASGVAVGARGFVLPPGDWAPVLRPPKGTFAKGGEAPKKWEMTVSVPTGFHVLASGHEHGHAKEKNGETHSFQQRREDDAPYVAGGAYQETRVAAAGGEVTLWTFEAMPRDLAERAAAVAARTAQFYDAEFGPREGAAHSLWIVECPTAAPCRPVPGAALPGVEMYSAQFPQIGLPLIAQQLAATWLDFRVRPNEAEGPLPMGALTEYAADRAAAAQEGGEAREQEVRRLVLRLGLTAGDDQGLGILRVRRSDPAAVLRYSRDKSALFFFALEDAVGKDNLDRALLHLLNAYRGRAWRAVDLRVAVEQESGKDLAGFFRKWLTEPGVPKEFQGTN